MKPIIDIVILSWAKDDKFRKMTIDCINSIYTSETNIDFNVIVVETNPDVNYNVKTMHLINEPTFNYNRFANAGIEFGCNELVVYCNNDLKFYKGWATELLKYNFDSMSPISHTTQTQFKWKTTKNPIFGYQIAQQISGWCIAIKRSVWEAIGHLDEEFPGWFADNVYAEQLKANGFDHFLIPTSRVDHLDGGSKTLSILDNITKEQLTFDCARKYNRKYGTNHFNVGSN